MNIRILVVDDNPSIVMLTRHKLLKKGYEVLSAQNGQDALEIARKEYPDLIISDVDMPIMDGYEFCSKVKEDSRLRNIPFILVTSLQETGHIIKGFAAGADNYLTKPSDEATLLQKIEELLANGVTPPVTAAAQTITIEEKKHELVPDFNRLLSLFLSAYRNSLAQNRRLEQLQDSLNHTNNELEITKKEYESLLLNIFPSKVAENLLAYGSVLPERVQQATVMFTDFEGFSKIAPGLSPEKLIEALSFYFDQFDAIIEGCGLVKIKTIGDSYMAAAGILKTAKTQTIDSALAALRILDVVRKHENKNSEIPYLPVRIGIHTGPAVLGVIGKTRFAYDMWGNTVNFASRLEEYALPNGINISESAKLFLDDFFEIESRGCMDIRNMGSKDIYAVLRLKEEYSDDDEGVYPNKLFMNIHKQMNT